MSWLKRVPIACWVVAAAFLIYSNFFAPQSLVASDWWLIFGIALFWATFSGVRGLAKLRRRG